MPPSKPDLLLIYEKPDPETLVLRRLGSHSDLLDRVGATCRLLPLDPRKIRDLQRQRADLREQHQAIFADFRLVRVHRHLSKKASTGA